MKQTIFGIGRAKEIIFVVIKKTTGNQLNTWPGGVRRLKSTEEINTFAVGDKSFAIKDWVANLQGGRKENRGEKKRDSGRERKEQNTLNCLSHLLQEKN